ASTPRNAAAGGAPSGARTVATPARPRPPPSRHPSVAVSGAHLERLRRGDVGVSLLGPVRNRVGASARARVRARPLPRRGASLLAASGRGGAVPVAHEPSAPPALFDGGRAPECLPGRLPLPVYAAPVSTLRGGEPARRPVGARRPARRRGGDVDPRRDPV